jgi:putative addiction module component (TIGR02574 family)
MNDDLFTQALKLPEPQRAALARQLLLSLEPDDFDEDSEAAWATELEARLAAIEQGKFEAKDWRESLAEIRQSLATRTKS